MNHWKDGGATTPQPIQPECDIKISQNTRQHSIGVAFNVTAVTAGGAATEGALCGNRRRTMRQQRAAAQGNGGNVEIKKCVGIQYSI